MEVSRIARFLLEIPIPVWMNRRMFRTIFIQVMIYFALIIKRLIPHTAAHREIFQSYVELSRANQACHMYICAVLYLTRIMCVKRLISKTGKISIFSFREKSCLITRGGAEKGLRRKRVNKKIKIFQ